MSFYANRGIPLDQGSGPSEVSPRLYVGNIEDCKTWEGPAINVTEGDGCPSEHCSRIQIMGDRNDDVVVPATRLNRVLAKVRTLLATQDKPILLHCWVGCERSPLAASWVISNLREIPLRSAWDQVARARKIAVDRRSWLTEQPYRPKLYLPKMPHHSLYQRANGIGGYYLDDQGHWVELHDGTSEWLKDKRDDADDDRKGRLERSGLAALATLGGDETRD